jgi:hypothetical protein
MNRFILFMCLLSGTVLLFLTGCEGPAGPQGSKGDQGDVTKSIGFDTLTCGKCHIAEYDTAYHVAARKFQWENSVHATGGHAYENGSSCAECHTNEGFIQKMTGQAVSVSQSSPPGCFACHSPHLRLDFSPRKDTPVSLASNIVGVAASSFDYGKGNLCVQCHHPRSLSPLPDPTKTALTDTFKTTSTRWSAHYGVQGQVLMGAGGFLFQGYPYSFTSNPSFHSTSSTIKIEGCIICHMASPVGNLGGGHTMKLEYENEGSVSQVLTGCKVCHGVSAGAITSLDYHSKMTEVQNNMDTLKSQLVTKGWMDTTNAIIFPLNIAPAARVGALFNYMLVLHDGSGGVHNTNFTLELLRSSIAELRKP